MTKSECVSKARLASHIALLAVRQGMPSVAATFRADIAKLMRQARSYVGPGY